jgi:hypothetical protein
MQAITAFVVTIMGLIGAFFVGQLVGEGNVTILAAGFAAIVGITIALTLGPKIWLLIPICWPLTGKISALPIPLNVRELAIFAVVAYYLVMLVFKRRLHKPQTSWLEVILLLNILWIASVFARNPVGVRAMGTEMLGGRPYFEIAAACCAFWVLTRTVIPAAYARLFPLLMAAGSFFASMLGLLTTLVPGLTPLIAPFYSGVDTTTYLSREYSAETEDRVGRLTELRGFGVQGTGVMLSLYNPFSLLNPLNVIPAGIFFLSILFIFLSGFRGALIGAGASFVIAAYFWGGLPSAIRAVFLAIAAVALLVSMQSIGINLPMSAQRALSVIPAEWDREAVESAKGTSEWRVDMWNTVLANPDLYLRNPAFGTGFGFSERDLEIQLSASFGGAGYFGGSQYEAQLISGAFHNGPLSAIRYAGVVGLLLYYTLMFTMLAFAFKLVKHTKGSPYFYLAVFLALPITYGLVSYTFIYGAYDGALQGALFSCAMLRCTSESHRLWLKQTSKPAKADQESDRPVQDVPAARVQPVVAHS